MDLSRGGSATVAHDIVTQLLLARGVVEADLARNRTRAHSAESARLLGRGRSTQPRGDYRSQRR